MTEIQGRHLNKEQWLPVADYDGYEVSDRGNVRSLRRKGNKPRMMTPFPWKCETFYVQMRRNGTNYRKAVAAMVLEAFGPPARGRTRWRHIDGKASNCRITNLEWTGNPTSDETPNLLGGQDHLPQAEDLGTVEAETEAAGDPIPDDDLEGLIDIDLPDLGEPEID